MPGEPSAREINEQYHLWTSLNSTTRLTDRIGAIADIHVRRNDLLADPSFDLLRVGGHCWVSDELMLRAARQDVVRRSSSPASPPRS